MNILRVILKRQIIILINTLFISIHAISNTPPCYNLVWSDEFSGNSLDETKWAYYTWGWTSSEVQNCYRQDNVTVNNGTLKLTANYEPGVTCSSGSNFSSGFVETRDKAYWTYGYFEARVKLPASNSTWPAFWMSPQNSEYGEWPRSGEIDIFEVQGHDMTRSHGNAHWGESTSNRQQEKGTYTFPAGNNADNWHIYGVEWNEGELKFYIDDVHYHTINNFDEPNATVHPGPFNIDFYLRLNVAVGGTYLDAPWNDAYNALDQLPAAMEVDWVRVYQKSNNCDTEPNPNQTDCNLIQNADFSAGQSPWQTYVSTSANASLSTNAGFADFTITNGSTDKYKIQLFQSGILLEQGKTYEISFRAKADVNKSIYVKLSNSADNMEYEYQNRNITATWTTQSFTYTMSNATDSNARLSFGIGSNSTDISIDDVLVKEQNCVPVISVCNEVENANFSSGQQPWQTDINNANASLSTNVGYADFTISNGGSGMSKVKLFQTGLNLEQGKTYNISFSAKADANKAIYVKLSDENENITQYDWEDFTINTSWNTYIYTYNMGFATDNTARISFGVGGNTTDIAFDNVIVEEQDCDSPTVIYGCTEQCSPNYNANATVNDGSCEACPPPPNTCNSNARLKNPANAAAEGAFAKFAQSSFTNNFIRAEKAYIKHQREIHRILNSKEKKYVKVVADFEAIKGIALNLLYTTFTKFGQNVTISSGDIQVLNEFLVRLSKASETQSLQDEIDYIRKYIRVMQNKSVKKALVAFDKAAEKDIINMSVNNIENLIDLNAFPNPFEDKISINLSNIEISTGITSLYNAKGELVSQISFENKPILEIETKTQPTGMYFIQIQNKDKIYTKKLLKQ